MLLADPDETENLERYFTAPASRRDPTDGAADGRAT